MDSPPVAVLELPPEPSQELPEFLLDHPREPVQGLQVFLMNLDLDAPDLSLDVYLALREDAHYASEEVPERLPRWDGFLLFRYEPYG